MKENMKHKVLVVDDDDGIVEALELMLEGLGYEIEVSYDGKALENLKKENLPDLILLDLLLSGRNGEELCQLLKKDVNTKKIPVILMSAHPGAEVQWRESGAEEFIAKPFEIKELEAKIAKYLN